MSVDLYNLSLTKSLNKLFLGKLREQTSNIVLDGSRPHQEIIIKKNSKNFISVKVRANTKARLIIWVRDTATISLSVKLNKASSLSLYQLILRPDYFGSFINIDLLSNSELTLSNLVILGGQSETVLKQNVNHLRPNTKARVFTRRVQFDGALSVIYGLLNIHKQAKQTDSYLSDKALLMGDKCKAISEPSLEISTDSVKASHSATSTRLPIDDIFYLQSRGLSELQAKELLIKSFCMDILPKGDVFSSIIERELFNLRHVKS